LSTSHVTVDEPDELVVEEGDAALEGEVAKRIVDPVGLVSALSRTVLEVVIGIAVLTLSLTVVDLAEWSGEKVSRSARRLMSLAQEGAVS
jgi:hypothetical protein